jgi:hypothetical protein
MSGHVWRVGDSAFHEGRGVIVEVVKLVGPNCLIVEFEATRKKLVRKGRSVSTTSPTSVYRLKFATSPRDLILVEDCTE